MKTAAKPCPAAPAREYGINNTSMYRARIRKANPLLHTVTKGLDRIGQQRQTPQAKQFHLPRT